MRDGRRLTVRPIQREDAGLLIEFHERLSPQSRYLRFFSPVPHLSPKMAEYLAGVDFVDRFALVASADEDGVERIVAVARFAPFRWAEPRLPNGVTKLSVGSCLSE